MAEAIGHSAVIQRSSDGTSGGVFTTVGSIRDIDFGGLSRDTVETTNMVSTERWREYIGGLKDGGELSFEITFDPDHADFTAFELDLNTDTSGYYKIVWPDADEWGFAGFVTGIDVNAPVDDRMSAQVTIKVTGKPGWIA